MFIEERVDLGGFQAWLAQNDLALLASRNVTQRDRSDVQQPYNLAVPGGVESLGDDGHVYGVSRFQVFEADLVRGYADLLGGVLPGRRVLSRPVRATGEGSSGSVMIAADGSVAALVPARRALTWQLADEAGVGLVRERYWVSFAPGEVRVCKACHGINVESQTGDPPPEPPPEALRELLRGWAGCL